MRSDKIRRRRERFPLIRFSLLYILGCLFLPLQNTHTLQYLTQIQFRLSSHVTQQCFKSRIYNTSTCSQAKWGGKWLLLGECLQCLFSLVHCGVTRLNQNFHSLFDASTSGPLTHCYCTRTSAMLSDWPGSGQRGYTADLFHTGT